MKMNQRLVTALRRGLTACGILSFGTFLLGSSVGTTYDATGHFSGFTIRANEACAYDGSCAPAPGWVCGLNGRNYVDKLYVKP